MAHKLSIRFISFFAVIAAVLLSGCASSAVRAPGQAAAYTVTQENPIRKVSVSMDETVDNNVRFDVERLQRVIEIELDNLNFYDAKNSSPTAPELDVEVIKLRVRSTFNAVMWGAMAGNDSVHGTVVIRDRQGKKLDQFTVKTSYALGGVAGGMDGTRMDWLYEAFAKEIVEEFVRVIEDK